MLRYLVLFALVFCTGCNLVASRSLTRFMDAHYVLDRDGAGLLQGPFAAREAVSSTCVALMSNGQTVSLRLRGVLGTGQPDLDRECFATLSMTHFGGIYLRIDSTYDTADGGKCGVIYTPANQVFTGWDEHGVLQYETLTYVMPQLLMITQGYCLVDHSDTAYPLYEVFRKAEELARKARRGYWADPTHRQVPRALPISGSAEGAP